jgi:hypothetical protein
MSNLYLSRRSIVASAAALPALAVPAAAIAATTPADFDKAAMIRRAEELVEVFSTMYIREGWHENFDEARAAEFLENVRRFEMSAHDSELEANIITWANDHGVSFDWLLVGDHASLIAYRACHAAPPFEPDPIFVAIEKERALGAAFTTRYRHEHDLAAAGVELERAAPDDSRTPEMVAFVDASVNARWELAETAPTTLAGMIAYLDYLLVESEKLSGPETVFFFDGNEETLMFVRSLAQSAKKWRAAWVTLSV